MFTAVWAWTSRISCTSLNPHHPWAASESTVIRTSAARTLFRVAKKMKTQLEKVGRADPRHPIILDHATQHTAANSRKAMKELGLTVKGGFPAQGWDINIIENVWGVLETKLQGFRASRQQLQMAGDDA
jgi:hypothetical protein